MLHTMGLRNAADVLGISVTELTAELQKTDCPYGFAVKKGNKYLYYLFPEKVQEYVKKTSKDMFKKI